jgi:hypothetical protein
MAIGFAPDVTALTPPEDRQAKSSPSSAVTSYIGSLRRYLTHHARAHVLERILKFDLFGNRNTVFRDVRPPNFFLNDVAMVQVTFTASAS